MGKRTYTVVNTVLRVSIDEDGTARVSLTQDVAEDGAPRTAETIERRASSSLVRRKALGDPSERWYERTALEDDELGVDAIAVALGETEAEGARLIVDVLEAVRHAALPAGKSERAQLELVVPAPALGLRSEEEPHPKLSTTAKQVAVQIQGSHSGSMSGRKGSAWYDGAVQLEELGYAVAHRSEDAATFTLTPAGRILADALIHGALASQLGSEVSS